MNEYHPNAGNRQVAGIIEPFNRDPLKRHVAALGLSLVFIEEEKWKVRALGRQ